MTFVKKLKFFIAAMLLVSCTLFYFYKKRGSSLSIEQTTSARYLLLGKEFNGSTNDEAFKNIFVEIKKKTGETNSPIFMVHYELSEPSKANNYHVNTFVGFEVEDTSSLSDASYEHRIFQPRKIVKGSSTSHFIFQGSVYPKLNEFIEKKKLTVDSTYLVEKYGTDDNIEIEMGVK
ncbi:MAG: hypothetical protein AB8B61_03445 [Cyclobacteriaceae bacterium]